MGIWSIVSIPCVELYMSLNNRGLEPHLGQVRLLLSRLVNGRIILFTSFYTKVVKNVNKKKRGEPKLPSLFRVVVYLKI